MPHLRLIHDPGDAAPLMGLRRSVRVARVAEALDMDDAAVRRLVAAGDLEGHRVGKRGIRIYVDSVDEYCRRNLLGGKKAPPPRADRPRGPSASAREALAALRAAGVFD